MNWWSRQYFHNQHSITIFVDGVGNIVSYEDFDAEENVISKHQYKSGGILANFKMGIVRATVILKER